MSIPKSSTPQEIEADVKALRASFRSGAARDFKTRRHHLLQLQKMLKEGRQELRDAMWKDLRKNAVEVDCLELSILDAEVQEHLEYFEDWAQPEKVGTNLANLPGSSYIHRDPLGVVCVIGTWNYPVQLTLGPVIGAISAGNCVVLRIPGDDTSINTNAALVRLLDQYMDKQILRVVHGGVEASKVMLQQRFDLIFCTGGTFIGKIVAEAAAKTLTPTILELGGKTPSIVDETCDINVCVKRIAWAAFLNAGQTCVRPDYVMVSSKIGDKFVKAMEKTLTEFFGANPKESESYGRIINDRSYSRVSGLLTKDFKNVTFGGSMDEKYRYIAPTLLNFKRDFHAFDTSACMSQEIFGPIMPIFYYDSLDEAIDYVNNHEKPLSLYVYSSNAKNYNKVLKSTSSGGAVVNDAIMHLSNPELPFGGVGHSGMGGYHGRSSFDSFSHKKSVLVRGTMMDVKQRYQPYTKSNGALIVYAMTPFKRSTLATFKFLGYTALIAAIAVAVKYASEHVSITVN